MTTSAKKLKINLGSLLRAARASDRQALETFALLNLGLVESLRNGALNANDGVAQFYNAANCLYVRRAIKNSVCDEIMSRGVQLPDLFEILSPSLARRELATELNVMGKLCLKLLRGVQPKPNDGLTRSGPRRRAG
jgi:hypothetical protein